MNCERCGSLAYHHVSGGEFSIICDFCGLFVARQIERIVHTEPIYKDIALRPKGVVMLPGGNLQYFTQNQLEKIIKENNNYKGYTFCVNNHWYFYDKRQKRRIPVEKTNYSLQD